MLLCKYHQCHIAYSGHSSAEVRNIIREKVKPGTPLTASNTFFKCLKDELTEKFLMHEHTLSLFF